MTHQPHLKEYLKGVEWAKEDQELFEEERIGTPEKFLEIVERLEQELQEEEDEEKRALIRRQIELCRGYLSRWD